MLTTPQVSIILPTRDRPEQLSAAIQAILGGRFDPFEVLVVDQSRSPATARLVRRVAQVDDRVRFVPDGGAVGSSHARNVGIAASRGELLVFTDDDCVASPYWLEELVSVFGRHPDVGAVSGAVVPGPHDSSAGFIVGYAPRRRERFRGRLAKLCVGGIGANMALRRSVLAAIGGWDEMLGAGAPFDGAADLDLLYRTLAAGYTVMHVPEASVIHHGFRDWAHGGRVIRGRFRGIAAVYAKHIRLGDTVALVLFAQQIWLACANIARSAVHLTLRPVGLGRLWALFAGAAASRKFEIDPRTRCYRPLRSCIPEPSVAARQRVGPRAS
jgi:GT2 family glycosyltransferase